MRNRFKALDPWLYVLPFILALISVVVIYTLTINSAGPGTYLRQAVYALLGIPLILAATTFDYRNLKGWAPWAYGFGLISLLAVKLIGKSDFGAQRWIDLKLFQFQPGEFEKIIVIVVLATILARPIGVLSNSRFLLVLLVLFVPFASVLIQPDLGTALVIMVSGLAVLVHARLSRLQRLMLMGGALTVMICFGLSFHGVKPFDKLLKPYQKDRLASFIDPSRDKTGSGYNVEESVIAVGSGGLSGKGLGFGSQSQLNFLPVAHADFIFAGIAEAWGLVGSWAIVGLFAILLSRLLLAARIAKDEFGMLLCIGIAAKIAIEVLVNVGMNIRLMPVTGIPLPFLSFGGTTMLTNMLAIGLVQSVVIRYKRLTF